MKIQIMSDLHFEHHDDGGVGFIKSLKPKGIDALVLAGDIAEEKYLAKAIKLLCKKYPKVIFVPGNHEYYNSDAGTVYFNFEQISEQNPNFHFLDNKILELNGKRFLGATLWYPYVAPYRTMYWSDFICIRGFNNWVFEENTKAKNFLNDNLRENDIVISHFLPSFKSVADEYLDSPENVFFVCDMEPLIEERKPALWIHGHTHRHVDVKVGETRIIANPRGYLMYHETVDKNGYIHNMSIDV